MLKRAIVSAFVSTFLAFSFVGCSSKDSGIESLRENPEFEGAPSWVLNPQLEGGFSAIGVAKLSKAGMQFTRTQAMANGRDELARQISIKVNNMVKDFTQATGVAEAEVVDKVASTVSKQVTSQTLNGTVIKDMWISKTDNLYVLMVLDPKMATTMKDTIKGSVASSYKNDEALWQQFQSKKAQEELDKAVSEMFK